MGFEAETCFQRPGEGLRSESPFSALVSLTLEPCSACHELTGNLLETLTKIELWLSGQQGFQLEETTFLQTANQILRFSEVKHKD